MIKTESITDAITDWFDKYDRSFIGTKELKELIAKLEQLS